MTPRKLTVNKGHKENISFVCIFSTKLRVYSLAIAIFRSGMSALYTEPGMADRTGGRQSNGKLHFWQSIREITIAMFLESTGRDKNKQG
jgi:hypothetical protein